MGLLDEIGLGPVRLELREEVAQDGYLILVHTKSTGTHGMGTPTTLEEWREAKRVAGLEGLMGESTYKPDERRNVDIALEKGAKARSIT